jgi:hypothetical protein
MTSLKVVLDWAMFSLVEKVRGEARYREVRYGSGYTINTVGRSQNCLLNLK